jgi:hypothetical protein
MDNAFITFPVSCLAHMLGRMILSSYSSCCTAGLFGLTCHLHKFGIGEAIPIGITFAGQAYLSLVVPALPSGDLNSQALHVAL